jgi:L-lactate utilization protein LutC
VVSAVLAYLSASGLKREVGLAGTPLLTSLQWPADMVIHSAVPRAQHLCVISQAIAGIAETGSLVMRSHGTTPVSMNFLPDHFLCLLPESQLVDHIEDVWQLLRDMAARMPRAINLVTGPSRTADVEQTIQLGAHGPRQLHVILLANE